MKLDGYQRRLFVFLSVATFFEGYDFAALVQILPHLRTTWGLDKGDASWLTGVINVGTVLAYLVIGRADRWGRKRVLTLTIIGYTIFTALSGLAPNVWFFAFFQLFARIFLIGEWATSMVIAAEEFPAERRGMVIGVIGAAGTLGHVICTGLVPALVALGTWRLVYFVGIVPLVIIAFARRNLRETARFTEQQKTGEKVSLLSIWSTPFRRRVIELSAIWFLTYMGTNNAVFFWKDYAMTELGMPERMASKAQVIAALAAMPLVFAAGKLLDLIGRKRGATVIYLLTAVGIAGSYTAEPFGLVVVCLTLAIVGITAALTVLNTFTTELFPTELRGSAFAWTNNLLGRIGYWGSPFLLAPLVRETGWAPTLRITAVFPVLALLLVLWLLPETGGRKLEETARA